MTLSTMPSSRKWEIIALLFSICSLIVNLEWISIPFSSYGLRGQSGVFYGAYTLYITFSFHPAGWVWWTTIGLQIFATLVLLMLNSSKLDNIIRFSIFAVPGALLLLLDLFITERFGTIGLWTMYILGATPGTLLLVSGVCYTKTCTTEAKKR
jgi:hypothetical protein